MLQKALNEPSLYDDVLAFLSRRGFKVPAEVLRRDPSKTYAPDPEVEKVWAAAYETDFPVKMLGETMADIAEEYTTWKYRHLMATRRTIGNRSAYFGTPAVSWLLPTLEDIPFSELFSARAFIGDQPPAASSSLPPSVLAHMPWQEPGAGLQLFREGAARSSNEMPS